MEKKQRCHRCLLDREFSEHFILMMKILIGDGISK